MIYETKFKEFINIPEINQMYLNESKTPKYFNKGRWKEAEHKKFLEAIILYGSDWKSVHKYIKSRSSNQSRSHAQKFILKLKKKLNIIPNYDHENTVMVLSEESIQKLIREMIDRSSMKNLNSNNKNLYKLVTGFSKLIIGKSKYVSFNGESSFFYNYLSPFSKYLIKDGMLVSKEDLKLKYFSIQKINKEDSMKNSNNQDLNFLLNNSSLGERFFEINNNNNEIKNSDQIRLINFLLNRLSKNIEFKDSENKSINLISIDLYEDQNREANSENFSVNQLDINLNQSLYSELAHDKSNFEKDHNESIKILNKSNTITTMNHSDSTCEKVKLCHQEINDENSSFFSFNNKVDEEADCFFNL